MPSFDVVNRVDMQEVRNAVNNAGKEITQRYDFRGSNTTIELDTNIDQIIIRSEDEMKMEAVKDVLQTHAIRRKIDVIAFAFREVEQAGGKTLRQEVAIKQGIDQEIGKRIVKEVKDTKIKVQVAIQGDELRVSGKKRDDLQSVIKLLKEGDYEVPLQFVNMRD